MKMDEYTVQAAQRATDLFFEQARASHSGIKTYTVIALGKNDDRPISINAKNAQERSDQMKRAGVDLSRDNWAAGYVNGNRSLQVCGNNDEAKRLVEQHLRNKR